jgi:condensin-2 complex subunit D3
VARNAGDEDVEEDAAATAMADARGKLVSSIMKKNLMENVVPTLIELRTLFAEKRSPLTGTLMATLRVLLKDYKSEIADLLACDKQLARELLYDIQQSEAAEKAAAEVEAAAAALREESQATETQATAIDTQTPAAARTRYIGYNQAFSRIVTATGPASRGRDCH